MTDPEAVPWQTAPEIVRADAPDMAAPARARAIELARRHGPDSATQGTPRAIAAAAVYIAGLLGSEPRTQEEVADTMGIGTVAIRENYHRIVDAEGIDGETHLRALARERANRKVRADD